MFINMNLSNVAEPKPVSPGRYNLTISDAKFREVKRDIEVSLGIDGHLDAPNIRHFISLPKSDDDAGKVSFKQLMLKRFLVQFNIPFNDSEGFNIEDFNGQQAAAQLNLSEPDDSGTVYNRMQLDKLANEPTKAPVAKARKS